MKTKRDPTLIYTRVDEAPGLATYSLLPILKAFVESAGITVQTRDISLAGRILARFPDFLSPEQRISDDLEFLGNVAKQADANIIKLPNISASLPQLKAAIKELQVQGYAVPDYPDTPRTDAERSIKSRYDAIKGSAVNPVLREGNSIRRIPSSVKNYARRHPHSMGEWTSDSRSHVAHMKTGDMKSNEVSLTVDGSRVGKANIEFVDAAGKVTVLKESIPLNSGDVIDASYLSVKALRAFLSEQIEDARRNDVLFSIHLKATMMKVSDPIIFGHALEIFFREVFEKHAETFARLGVNPSNGLADLAQAMEKLPSAQRKEIEEDLQACYQRRPKLAMVNSDRGITNLHFPNDVIIDASMPAAIRNSGQMWGPDGKLHDTKFVIPDSSYAGVYGEVFDFCSKYGAFDPKTMGTVPNIGLMAKRAEEYGSHDKTFVAPADGLIRLVSESGETLLPRTVEKGDIWRMCQTRDLPIQDWVKLAVQRARSVQCPAFFWLDQDRAHDAQLIQKVQQYLRQHETDDLDIRILSPVEAARLTCQRLQEGKDTLSVTGNVLRDYLTDLFPILEVGTSAKMLSIVPLLSGGGLFETGAGGSAPKHVQQFLEEGHLRWDSLGEFLALAASLEHLGIVTGNKKARILADALDKANGLYLENNKSPSRKCGEIDNRGSHFYLAQYWARELASGDYEDRDRFLRLARELEEQEDAIQKEFLSVQGKRVDLGGYYRPDEQKALKAMRPSHRFNRILASE